MGKQRRRGPIPIIGGRKEQEPSPAELLGPVAPAGGSGGARGLRVPGLTGAEAEADPASEVEAWLEQQELYQEAMEEAVERSIEEGVSRAKAVLSACNWQREERILLLSDYRTDETLIRIFFDAIIDARHHQPPYPEPLNLNLRPRIPANEDLPPVALDLLLGPGLAVDLTTVPWVASGSFRRYEQEAAAAGSRLAMIWGDPAAIPTFLACGVSAKHQERARRGLKALEAARTLRMRSDLGTDFTVELGDPETYPRRFIGEPPREPGAIGAPLCVSVTAPFVPGSARGTLVFQSAGRFQSPVTLGFAATRSITLKVEDGRVIDVPSDHDEAKAIAEFFARAGAEQAYRLGDCNVGFDPRGDLSTADNTVVHSFEGGVMIGIGKPMIERPDGSRAPGYHLDLMFPGTDVDLDGKPFIRRGKFTRESGVR